jgi:hypothetical protein
MEKHMTYLLDCWIRPRSGFDLRDHNLMLSVVHDMFSSFDLENGTNISETIEDNIDKKYDGMVIHTFTIKSDKTPINIETDLLPQIKKDYPEAELITYTCLPKRG